MPKLDIEKIKHNAVKVFNTKDEMLHESDYDINVCVWEFLDELQARIIKQHILETLMPSFDDFKYFSKEEQEAEAKVISANAIAHKENFYDYYEERNDINE